MNLNLVIFVTGSVLTVAGFVLAMRKNKPEGRDVLPLALFGIGIYLQSLSYLW